MTPENDKPIKTDNELIYYSDAYRLEECLCKLQSYLGNRVAVSIASGTHDMWAVAVYGGDGKVIVQEMGPSLKNTIETIKSKLS